MNLSQKMLNSTRTCTEQYVTALEGLVYDGYRSINRHMNAII